MTPQEKLDNAVAQPRSVYRTPEEVLVDHSLTDDQKRRVLQSWEQDARELAVAEEENMGGGEPDMLDRVVRALATLPAGDEKPRGPATIHGSPARPSSAGATDAAATLSPEEARQGEIVLKTKKQRRLVLGGVALSLVVLTVAFSLA